jgi:hypothetical protein
MSTIAYQPLTDVENAFKTIVWLPLIKTGEVALAGVEATIPVLDLPFFQGLEDDAINAIADWAFNQLVQLIDVEAIVLVKAEQQNAWATASAKLSILAASQGVNSDAYKQALADSAADFAKFVHSGS